MNLLTANEAKQAQYNVAVIELIWRGHTPTFFRIVSEAFLSLGCMVTLICPEPEEIRLELISRGCTESKIKTRVCKNFSGITKSRFSQPTDQKNYFTAVNSEILKLSPQDLLYFSLIDPLIHNIWGLLVYLRRLRVSYAGLWMHPYLRNQSSRENTSLRNRIYEAVLKFTLKKNCIGLTTLDEGAADVLSQKLGKKVLRFPDCAEPNDNKRVTETASKLKKYASGRKIVGVVGVQAAWKGVFLALEAAAFLSKELVWAFVGPDKKNEEETLLFRAAVQNLNERGYNIFTEMKYVSDDDYNNVIALSDIIWCVYPYHRNSSNTLAKAASGQKPVVAINHGLIGERVDRFNLGISVNAEAKVIAAAIATMLDDSYRPDYCGMRSYLEEHDIGNVKLILAELLQKTKRLAAT